MAKLADALDLGSSAARRGGSSPLFRTIFLMKFVGTSFFISFYLDKSDYINVFNGVVLCSRIIANMMLNYIISYKYRYAYDTRWSSKCTISVLKIYPECSVFMFLFIKKRTILSRARELQRNKNEPPRLALPLEKNTSTSIRAKHFNREIYFYIYHSMINLIFYIFLFTFLQLKCTICLRRFVWLLKLEI